MNDIQCINCGENFTYFIFFVEKFQLRDIYINNVNDYGKNNTVDATGDPTIFYVVIYDSF